MLLGIRMLIKDDYEVVQRILALPKGGGLITTIAATALDTPEDATRQHAVGIFRA